MPGDPHPAGPSLALSPWLGVYLQCGEVCDLVSQGSDAVITSINLQPRLQLHQLLVPTSVVPVVVSGEHCGQFHTVLFRSFYNL